MFHKYAGAQCMCFQPSIETRKLHLDEIPVEDRALVAERMGIAVEALLDHVFDACTMHDRILIERGDGMTPEEAEAFAVHCGCEYA